MLAWIFNFADEERSKKLNFLMFFDAEMMIFCGCKDPNQFLTFQNLHKQHRIIWQIQAIVVGIWLTNFDDLFNLINNFHDVGVTFWSAKCALEFG